MLTTSAAYDAPLPRPPVGGWAPLWTEVPTLPAIHVRRDRLLEHLDAALEQPVTLLCAPTGWGKTVLVSSWIRAGRAPGRVAYTRFAPNRGAIAWRQLTEAM